MNDMLYIPTLIANLCYVKGIERQIEGKLHSAKTQIYYIRKDRLYEIDVLAPNIEFVIIADTDIWHCWYSAK